MGVSLMLYLTSSFPYPPARLPGFLWNVWNSSSTEMSAARQVRQHGEQAGQSAQEGEPGAVPVEGRAPDSRKSECSLSLVQASVPPTLAPQDAPPTLPGPPNPGPDPMLTRAHTNQATT